MAFDPEHPENERELFKRLIDNFGSKIAHCIEPQADISTILPPSVAIGFMAQRADLLLAFPSGYRLLLEPGDHDDPNQMALDKKRDEAFQSIGIDTLRPRNSEIYSQGLYSQIRQHMEQKNVTRYLKDSQGKLSEKELAANYLFLLPSLIVRVERLFLEFMFRRGLIHQEELQIGIIERDIECAEIALLSFLDRLSRLMKLYGIALRLPRIEVHVQRNPKYRYGNFAGVDIPVEVCSSFDGMALDVLLDVGIKCNSLMEGCSYGATHIGVVRQVHPHNRPVRFGYRAKVMPIHLTDITDNVLCSFAQDFFRKHALRPGQGPILRNVLSQKSTIGLLPTSAGKSLCYQLASLLTPGTTLVVDPIVALMNDQVQSLTEHYGIDRVLAWHAGAALNDQNVTALLTENAIIFLSPERLQRPQFRGSMRALNAADIFINYAVIDEAHCVSMWGHDFRPSYLTLERNFRDYCTFQGRTPVIVALTGTASQLVLIDLKRELDIQDLDAIIRPDTFDRPELNFNLVKCPNNEKIFMLKQVMAGIERRLNVGHLDTDAYGIVFAYTPRELWKLFGHFVGDAEGYVRSVMAGGADDSSRYGVYTGSSPEEQEEPLFQRQDWEKYKARTLAAFKRGEIRMLFGNTAVSVGIDNEQLNYIVNYRMPQSLEAYYQQCGRAGRSGQQSECYLMFSDDTPLKTEQWLNRDIARMPRRWDDMGTVSFFHQKNFPGLQEDIAGAKKVFEKLFGTPDNQDLMEVPMYLEAVMPKDQAEKTERYLSYWLILGILIDYEVTGMERNTVYHVRRHRCIDQFLHDQNEAALKVHIVDSLLQYLSRYRPTTRRDVERGIDGRTEAKLSTKSVGFLIEFIYSQIEYQRRQAIRTMVSFCNEKDTSPERLRAIIRAYFDSSEKFSDGLIRMADNRPDFTAVAALLDLVEGFDDVEHLYWETRRLLDERFRPDWAAANLFAIAYRQKGTVSDMFMRLFDDMVDDLSDETKHNNESALHFLTGVLSYLSRLDILFGEPLSAPLMAQCVGSLYEKHGLTYIKLIDDMSVSNDHRQLIHLYVTNLQLKEMTNANYSRIIG
ncbi:MAG: DEAD/DEAH box helicase [Dissulfurispiraceae bacterium]